MIKVSEPCVGDEELSAITEVLLSGNYISGKKVEQFETAFAEYIGVKYCIAVSSGTSALHIALACSGIGPGHEVIVPAMTFFSTITSVIHQNAIPIFADVNKDYCIDPESIKRVISEKTRAIIPVHLYGYAANMREILKIAEEYDLKVIEDCAQAHGTEYYGKKVGRFGEAGTFSFFATKNMTTGEGGIITTDCKEMAESATLYRSHGMSNRNDHIMLGYNHRMTEMEAAFGLVQLKKLDIFNAKRINNSYYLYEHLKDIPWIIIQKFDKNIKHTFFWCPVRIDEQKLGMSVDELKEILKKNGIGFRHRYTEPLYKQKLLVDKRVYPEGCPFSCSFYGKKVDYSTIFLPNAEVFSGRMIGLPNHPNLTKENLDRIIHVLRTI
ncbi:MAG: DegT/DnrJ/EryC1/StrS family aminotransferase [Colwellia sp.]|nr:DegT/DnrJ/EryC1/StrS family aminotransferase [Colwellia sp.]